MLVYLWLFMICFQKDINKIQNSTKLIMKGNKNGIDNTFVQQLLSHPAFQSQVNRLIKKGTAKSTGMQNQQVNTMADEICSLLCENYRQTVDRQAITAYQTCSQLAKDIDHMKTRLTACEAFNTEASVLDKGRQPDISLFSEVSAVYEQQQLPKTISMNHQNGHRPEQSSFIGSMLVDNRDYRQELQEQLRSSNVHFTQDLSKVENEMMQRLRVLELGVNRKIESIFKTLSNVFENINELQLKQPSSKPSAKNKLNQFFDTKVINTKIPDRSQQVRGREKQGSRRRSFLGINY